MNAAWVILYLGGLVHLLALNGYGVKHPAAAALLLPVAAALILPPLLRGRELPPAILRTAGLLGFAGALLFVKSVYLEGWDCKAWGPSLAMTGAGLGSLLPALASKQTAGAGTWLWISFWLGTGFLDPALPVLGAGLAGMLEGSGLGIGASAPAPKALRRPWLSLFLLGLALPKPWWDFGLERDWAWASAAVGAGAALASMPPLRTLLSRMPGAVPAWTFGLLAVAYAPAFGIPWGLALGFALGIAWVQLPRPLPLERAIAALLGGLLVSFSLHANAWLPGLRHLVWLGN